MSDPFMTASTQPCWEEKSAAVDALFEPWMRGTRPGGAVAVFCKGETVHKKGYGFANVSTGTRIDSKSPFRLASLTKPFVAMTIMMLEERGALKYDDPIRRYLPEFSSFGERITLRNLLTHTSGVEDYEELFLKAGVIDAKYPTPSEGGPRAYEPSLQETVELIARQPLRFMPGDEWEYSNSGYVLLASIAERVAGVPLARFMRAEIFEPLGMRDSLLSEHAQPEPELHDRAKGYISNEGEYTEADYSPLNAIYGPDGIYSTLDDMVKWCDALGSEKLVRTSTIAKAFTSGELNNGERTGYGFGWFIGRNFGLPIVSHTGSWMGYRSFLSYYPSERLGLLVLANAADFDDVTRSYVGNRLGKLYLGREWLPSQPIKVDNDILRRYEGLYELQDGGMLDIKRFAEGLAVKSEFFWTRLIPESHVKFLAEGAESDSYFFHEDTTGQVSGLRRHLSLYGYSKDAYSWARKLNTDSSLNLPTS
jgi:CubicO group peptidase (beta-lactamase class C family)